jgi:hypothetical protein
MTCRDFYLMAAVIAFFGGLAFAVVGMFFRFWARRIYKTSVQDTSLQPHFQDAKMIMWVSLVPQALLLSLPVIYPSGPQQVPENIAEPAVMCGSAMLALWIWAVLCFCRAGLGSFVEKNWSARLPTIMPALVSLLAMLGNIIREY